MDVANSRKGKGGESAPRLLEQGRCQGLNPSGGRPDTCPVTVAVTYCGLATVHN